MTDYTIFGAGAPSGVLASGDTSEISVSTAFYVLGVTGWRCAGIRIWIPAGTVISGGTKKAFLWGGGTGNAPTSVLATADFTTFVAGAWNTVLFSSPVSIIAGRYYWAQVYLPVGDYGYIASHFVSGAQVSVDTAALYAAGPGEVTTGQGSFVAGAAGQAPASNFNSSWYGVDVVVDDGVSSTGPSADNDVGITDAVTAVRSGLPTAVNATGSITDPTGLFMNAPTATFPIGGATAAHTKRRSLFDYRTSWGAVTNWETGIKGPVFSLDVEGAITLGLQFDVLWPVRFIGCKIYKAPNLAGSIPIRLWDRLGVGGAARELGIVTVNWVADEGGWREIMFPAPIDLEVGVQYMLTYYAANGWYAASTYVFYWFSYVETPLRVRAFDSNTQKGGGSFRPGTSQAMPVLYTPSNHYIEPIVEWDSTDPVFVPDAAQTYWDQWVNGRPANKIIWSVYYAEPPYIQEYADMGINQILAGFAGGGGYAEAIKAAGIEQVPLIERPEADPSYSGIRNILEDSAYGALVPAYYISDEPDLYHPYSPPDIMRGWCNNIRRRDSTRPLYVALGLVVDLNGTFYHQPQGSNMDLANELWRGWSQLVDVLGGDHYVLSPENNPSDQFGVHNYGNFTRRMRAMNEGRTPILMAIETTSETIGYPLPDMVVKAVWNTLIEGAVGFEFFDHRFGQLGAPRDHHHMLHNPPMKAAVSAMITEINGLADAVWCPDLGLVTAWTSSNKTSGPMGGTYGVPMIFTTRQDATYQYLFAQANRPGSTTATFTIPSWAGQTLTVIGESRTVTVDGSGVLTDDFAADYTVHKYRKG